VEPWYGVFMKVQFARSGGLLLFGAALAGCRVSASASAGAEVGAKSSGDASAKSNGTYSGAFPDVRQSIRLKEGKLDYEGVINFEYDKADLQKDKDTDSTLAEFEKFLTDHPNVNVEIEGHTDSRGSDDYNRDLSDRRAASVRKWLVGNGIAQDRITSVGKGEDHPQVPEPDACNDKEPKDTAPCEQAWASNRRVVFQVTKGAETIPVAPAPAPPPVVQAEPAPPEREGCPWLWGGHLNVFGPNSWIGVAGATQPGVCWLELSLGAGLGWNNLDGRAIGGIADGDFSVVNVPLRGRFWVLDTHSLIFDAGLAFSVYDISLDLDDQNGGTGTYENHPTYLLGNLGAGYGYRKNGAEAGPRLAMVIGALVHMAKISDNPSTSAGAPAVGAATEAEGELDNTELYAEISFGYLF